GEVDGMDGGQDLDERLTAAGARLGRQAHGGVLVAQDVPGDEVHHVERRAVDVPGLLVPVRGGDGDLRVGEGGDDPVLTAHVVGARQDVPERRATQHGGPARGVGDPVREVRVPAGDEVDVQRSHGSLDVV